MNVLLLSAGVLLLLAAATDALWTTLWVNGGGGPLSSRLAAALWKGLRRFTPKRRTRPEGRGQVSPLDFAGPVVLVAAVLLWVTLLWTGWILVFSADEGALVYSNTGERPGWAGRTYFAGYTLFTLGIGNVEPRGGAWEIVTAVASGSGMLFVTLGISYLISVLSAVVGSRSFASAVTGLGEGPEEVVRRGWNDGGYRGLTLPLNALSTQLIVLTQQHLAYPVLHYYHTSKAGVSTARAVALLDDALTVLRFGVPEACRPPAAVLEGARASVAAYLDTIHGAYVEAADRTPPPPDLGQLRTYGLPTLSDDTFAVALADLTERRRKLLGAVEADAWEWPGTGRSSRP